MRAVLILNPARTTNSLRKFRTGFFLLILIIAAWVYHATWLSFLGHALIQQDQPFEADAIVLLAGDSGGERIGKAVELAKAKLAPRILVSSAGHIFDTSEGELSVSFAVKRGAPPGLFEVIQHGADSTKEEAEIMIAECRRRGLKKILLVSSDYHTNRAGKIFRIVAPEMEIRTVGSMTQSFNPDSWWTNRAARKVWLMEAVKTVAFWLRM